MQFQKKNEKNVEKPKKNCNHYGIICDVGGKLKGNQDSALYLEFNLILAPSSPSMESFAHKGILALVADGVSGSNHGEEGSSYAISYFANKMFEYFLQENVEIRKILNVIHENLKNTNEALKMKYQNYISKGKVPKTTFVGTLIIGQWLWIFNLGDSQAFVVKDRKIKQISVDHIGNQTLHEITQAFGQDKIKPNLKVYNWAFENKSSTDQPVYNDSYYCLLCSDGLTDNVSSNEIKSVLTSKSQFSTLQEKVLKLYEMSMERGTNDNISIIAIDLAEYFECLDEIDIYQLKG
jgi:protein phosphatase